MNEEELLSPLYERIANRINPAKRMLQLIKNNVDLESIITEYGKV